MRKRENDAQKTIRVQLNVKRVINIDLVEQFFKARVQVEAS